MKKALLSLLHARRTLSFDELCREVPAARGPLAYYLPGCPDLAYWNGLSAEAVSSLASLRRAGVLRIEPWGAAGGARPLTRPPALGGDPEPAWVPALIVAAGAVERA